MTLNTANAADLAYMQAQIGIPRSSALGNEAIYIFGGQMAYQVSSGGAGVPSSYETVYELPARSAYCSNIRAIVAQSYGELGSPGGMSLGIGMTPISSLADFDAAGSWGGVTMPYMEGASASAIGMFNAVSVNTRSFAVTDALNPVMPARTDGGAKPLIAFRTYHGNGVSAALVGKSAATQTDFSSWASRTGDVARFRRNSSNGDQRASMSNWAAINTTPINGVVYQVPYPVCNVMCVGDSLQDGKGGGITYQGRNITRYACEALNRDQSGVLFVPSNLGWSSSKSQYFERGFHDALIAGLVPDMCVYIVGSHNDVDPLTEEIYYLWIERMNRFLALCKEYGVTPILATMPPCDAEIHDYGASDSWRTQLNSYVKATSAKNFIVADINSAVAGAVVGGHEQFAVWATTDHAHMNDAGIAAISETDCPLYSAIKLAAQGKI